MNAPDGWYGCTEYQEVTLTTKDGEVIAPCGSLSGSGCSGGDLDHPEEGYIRLARWSDTLLDVDELASVSICGVEIPCAERIVQKTRCGKTAPGLPVFRHRQNPMGGV